MLLSVLGLKGHSENPHTRPSKLRRLCKEKVGHLDRHGRAISDSQPQNTTSSRQATSRENASSRAFISTSGWDKSVDRYHLPAYSLHSNSPQSSYQSQVNNQRRNEACYGRGLSPSGVEFRPFVDNVSIRSRNLASSATSHAYANPRYNSEIKNLNAENVNRALHSFPSRSKMYGWRK